MTDTEHQSPAPAADMAGSLGGTDPVRAGQRVARAVETALTENLLAARTSADIGQVLLAAVTVFLFAGITPAWMGMLWLVAFVGTGAARAVNRKRSAAIAGSNADMLALVRRDVWLSASLWGGWALLHAGADPKSLAFMLVIFAGLVGGAPHLHPGRR